MSDLKNFNWFLSSGNVIDDCRFKFAKLIYSNYRRWFDYFFLSYRKINKNKNVEVSNYFFYKITDTHMEIWETKAKQKSFVCENQIVPNH